MKKSKKVWLIVATVFVLAGLGVSAVALTMVGWDYTKLSNVKYETKTFEIGEDFDRLSVHAPTADVVLVPSGDDRCKVVCYEQEKLTHTVEVTDHTLSVKAVSQRNWLDYIVRFSFDKPKVTVYLPKKTYDYLNIAADFGNVEIAEDFSFGDMYIRTDTGSVRSGASCENSLDVQTGTGVMELSGVTADKASLTSSTGSLRLRDLVCRSQLTIQSNTGNIELSGAKADQASFTTSTGSQHLQDVICSGQLTAHASTGSVVLNGCDADSLLIKTSTGSVSGTLLSEKVFITDTSTGSVHVPDTTTGGRCEIKTSTGSIDIAIADK